jgi:WD40 repeat protein
MATIDDIAAALHAQLPAALHAHIPALAQVLARLSEASFSPAEARHRLADSALGEMLQALVGRRVPLAGGDYITIGNVTDSKAIAAGAGAVAIGDVVIHIHQDAAARMRVPQMALQPPEDFVPRHAELEQIVTLLLSPEKSTPAASIALRGAGGYGKTVLARAACHDLRIVAAFPDGILWVTLGEQPSDLPARLADLVEALTGQRPGFASVEAATSALAVALAERTCLLVVDDVWNPVHLRPFLQGGPRCARLITTRNRDVLPMHTHEVLVDAMRSDEALALISASFDTVITLRQELEVLAQRLGEWPLLLKLANGVLYERVRIGQTLGDALAYVRTALDRRGLVAFDARSAAERSQAVAMTIGVSLDLLRDDERARYADLAVFPEDTDIPLVTLARFWGATGGLDDFATEELCDLLARLSLLWKFDPAGRVIRLHDVVREYLAHAHGPDLPGWHTRLLDAYWPASGTWADLPAAQPYLWRYMAFHLHQAGRDPELRALLFDFGWLQAKLDATDVVTVLQDFAYLPPDPVVRQVHESIKRSAQVLQAQGNQLAGQLLGRLLGHTDPDVQGLLRQAARWAGATWLRPLTRSLVPPGDPLLFMLGGHEGTVRSVAMTPDGGWAITAGNSHPDGTVRLWDLTTGTELHTLTDQAERGGYTPLGLTSDGQYALIAQGSDVHIWNVATGTLQTALQGGHTAQIVALAVALAAPRAVSAASDGSLVVWDLDRRQPLCSVVQPEPAENAAMTPDGRYVATTTANEVYLWDLDGEQQIRSLTWPGAALTGFVRTPLALAPDGQRVYFGSPLHVWDLAATTARPAFANGTMHRVLALTIVSDANSETVLALTTPDDETIEVWDTLRGQRLHRLPAQRSTIATLIVTSGGDAASERATALVAHYDHYLRVWALENTAASVVEAPSDQTVAMQLDQLMVGISPDGRWAVVNAGSGISAVWDLESGSLVTAPDAHEMIAQAMQAVRDARMAQVTQARSHIEQWRATKHAAPSADHRGSAVFREGTRPIIAGMREPPEHIAAATDTRALSYVPERGKTSEAEESGQPDSRYALNLWDLSNPTEAPVVLLGHMSPITAVAMTPAGHHAVSGCIGRTVRVWDLDSGREVYVLRGHRGIVWDVQIAPNGDVAVSASEDRTLRVWDLQNGRSAAVYTSDLPMRKCALRDDGRAVVGLDVLGRIHLLRVEGI